MMDGFTDQQFESLYFTFKLVSGDTIICQVLSDTDHNVVVRDPFQINVYSAASDEGIRAMVYYSEWFYGSETRVHMIRKEHILSAGIPDKELKAEYSRLMKRKMAKDPKTSAKAKKSTFKKKDWTGLDFDIDNSDRLGLN